MGAGILPCTIHNNKLYFLFGKENKYADTPGWSDFGGGKDNNETPIQTALREGTEEFTGFLGGEKDIKKLLKAGVYKIEFNTGSSSGSPYTMHIFPMEYDAKLPMYYNNNQRFLHKKMSPKLMKESKVFEKSEIKWMTADDVHKNCKQFRIYFQQACNRLYKEKKDIEEFIRKRLGNKRCTFTRRSKTNTKTKTRRLR
jgi:hypothetical protein